MVYKKVVLEVSSLTCGKKKREEKKGGRGENIMPFINTKRVAVKNIFGIHGRHKKLKRDVCKIPIKTTPW